MIVTSQTLQNLRTMVRGEFATQMAALLEKGGDYRKLATRIQSNTASNTYGWLGDFPSLREWVGDRVIRDMKETAYAIVNKKYESTLGVDRVHIEDDNLGVYRTRAQVEAAAVVRFFETSAAALLKDGFDGLCFDGQPFFDTEHPVYPNHDGTGDPEDVSNIVGEGTGKPWFLLSLDGVLKPFIMQERSAPEMTDITDPHNETTFMKDKYLFGVRWRGNFGYGFWQQAVASKTALTAANYEAARLAMQTFKRDGGDPMGITPTHLVVSSENEAAARKILEAQLIGGGDSNPNYHTAELIVSKWL
jgi:phage major head subunit gpT-like protein